MAKFFCLLLCLALAYTGYALECYNCADGKACHDFTDKTQIKTVKCGQNADKSRIPACLKKVVEEKSNKAVNTTRMCVMVMADKTEEVCKAANDRYNVMQCEVCYDDLCNTATYAYVNLYTLMGSIVTFFAVKYMR